MEQLNFVIPNNFASLSPELFDSSYPKNNQLLFSISTHNQIPDANYSRENEMDLFKKTTVRFQTASAEKILKDMKSKKNKNNVKKKNNKSFNVQKTFHIQKIKNEWNDDVRTTGVFDESMKNKLFPLEVSKNRKTESEKQNPIYFNSFAEMRAEKEKENDNKFLNQIRRKKEEIKKTKLELEEERNEAKKIQNAFAENRKKFVEKHQKPNPSKKRIYLYPPQPKPILIESDSNNFQNLKIPSTLDKNNHKRQLETKKKEILNFLENAPKNEGNKFYDEIPTKEDGKRAEDLEFEKKNGRFSQERKNISQEKRNEKKIKNNSNPSSEKKNKNSSCDKKFKINENDEKLNSKIISIKKNLEPLMAVLKRKQNNDGKFPLGYNVLTRTCSKLLNIHSDNLIELIIDDILIEMAKILNNIEKTEELKKEKQKGKEIFHDFFENFKELQYLQDEIFQRRDKMNKFEIEFQKIQIDKSKISCKKIKKRVLKLDDRLIRNVLEIRNFNDLEGLNIDRSKIKIRETAIDEIIEEILEECFDEYKEIENNFVEELFKQEFN